MFICCKKNLLIRDGGVTLRLASGFMGEVADRWSGHWYLQAAIRDGSIVASEAGGTESALVSVPESAPEALEENAEERGKARKGKTE